MPVWLQRVFVIVYVLFCIELGLVLMVLPWMTGYWFSGGWLARWPELRSLLQSGFVRGAVSGLGLLSISGSASWRPSATVTGVEIDRNLSFV